MAVAVVPGLFVAVVTARREKFIQYSRQVLLQPLFEFNRADGSCAANTFRGINNGWPAVLSSLKTLLETGEPIVFS